MVLSSGETEPGGGGRTWLVVAAIVAVALAGVAAWYLTREPRPPTSASAGPATGPSPASTPSPRLLIIFR